MKGKLALGLILVAGQLLLTGCSISSRQPPLPRRAAVESTGGDETFTRFVDSADIIYFPIEAAQPGPRSGAVWKLLEALQRSGGFALGWDPAAGDEKTYRALLNETNKAGAQVITLNVSPDLLAAEAAPEFVPPAEDFERFARLYSGRNLKEPALRAEYKAALIRQQHLAEKIASHFREHRSEKMLVFLRRAEVSSDYGVPYFVTQKTKARQLILNPDRRPESERGLLTGRGGRGRLEIVNSAPIAGGDLL